MMNIQEFSNLRNIIFEFEQIFFNMANFEALMVSCIVHGRFLPRMDDDQLDDAASKAAS